MTKFYPSIVTGTMALSLLLTAGCTMSPKYERPSLPVSGQFSGTSSDDVKNGQSVAQTGWQDFFLSEELRGLITKGLENNRDLRVATLNIQAARAQYRIQRSELLPSVNADGAFTRSRTAETLSSTGTAQTGSQYSASVGMTAYEVDLFGRVRSLNEAALETYFATQEARNAVQISLIAEITNAYLTYLADRDQLALSEQTLTAQQDAYDLASRRFEAGIGTQLDLRQVETLLETARVDRIAAERRIAQDRNALELLIGSPMAEFEITESFQNVDSFVAGIEAGLPSDLLQNRPDIREAEHALKAANANIGAARAAFFPSITLTASGGTAGNDLSELFSGGSGIWSFAPRITMPIFSAGRNVANLDLANLRKEISVAQYERTIQAAFREVSDELVARATYSNELEAQKNLVAATEDAYKLAQARYEQGIDNYLAVLDARKTLYAAQQQEINTHRNMLSNYVQLYAALGGGQKATANTQ